jgi:molybdenum cofactor cytidylyltransferase
MTRRANGLVLAAGGSRRLGRPKQLLELRGSTLLGCTLDTARRVGFDQLLVTVGASADEVRAAVDLRGVEVVDNPVHEEGCSSSIVAALRVVDPASDGVVLLLGDQPDVLPADVEAVIGAGASSPIAVCRYRNGIGHPFWFDRSVFTDLAQLHGDKGVWRLLESGRHEVAEVVVDREAPLDVDTADDYRRLLAAERRPPSSDEDGSMRAR